VVENSNNNSIQCALYIVLQVYSLSTPARSFHSNGSNPKDKLRRIGVAPSTIICQHLIQEGTYGRIYTGILHHPLGETRDVLIKTVVGGCFDFVILLLLYLILMRFLIFYLFLLFFSLSHCLADGTSLSQVGYLLAEASLLCGVSHPNLLFPTAAYTELPGPPQIGYPLPAKGNLKL
jgi:RYK receptor-like tyrosine kinase